MSHDTVFALRRKELLEIILLVLIIGFLINITSQFVWDNFLVKFDFWTTAKIIAGLIISSFLIYFLLYVAKGYRIIRIAEFYFIRKLGEKIPEESLIPNYKGLWYAQDALRRLGSISATLNKKIEKSK